jgi:hypothetical protein
MPENYVLLERIELNASAASVTFANIPQTGYTDLKVVCSLRSSRTSSTDGAHIALTFNNNTSSVYSFRHIRGTGSAASSYSESGATSMNLYSQADSSSDTANTFSNNEIYIPNYTGSTNKSVSVDSVYENNATTAGQHLLAGLFSSTAAITSIRLAEGFGNNWVAGSSVSLYGIATVGTTPAIAPKASGGNIIDYDGTYWIHTFTSSGTFTPQSALSCDYLVIAGGGGGGGDAGGGGGAGGYRTNIGGSALSVLATSYAVTVGAGGAGGVGVTGTNGANSVFSSITSTGGGAGGRADVGLDGGSGGGGSGRGKLSGVNPAGGAASPSGQGNAGGAGAGSSSANQAGGGGGGAGAIGAAAAESAGGNGGSGSTSSITGSSVTRAGGGGGGRISAGTYGTGGSGGGGNGGAPGTAGTVNTGSGGGASDLSPNNTGGAGGSGIVIIRYPAA